MQVQEVMVNKYRGKNIEKYEKIMKRIVEDGRCGICPNENGYRYRSGDPCDMSCHDCQRSDVKDWKVRE